MHKAIIKYSKLFIKFNTIAALIISPNSMSLARSQNIINSKQSMTLRQKVMRFNCTHSLIQCQSEIYSSFSPHEIIEIKSEFEKIRSEQPMETQNRIDKLFSSQTLQTQSLSEIQDQLNYLLESSASLLGVVQGLAVVAFIVYIVNRMGWIQCERQVSEMYDKIRAQKMKTMGSYSGSAVFSPIANNSMTETQINESFASEYKAKACKCHDDLTQCSLLESNNQSSDLSIEIQSDPNFPKGTK